MAWMIPIMSANTNRGRGEEDQLLAALIQQDTAQRYEFKILHGGPNTFRGQERLQRVLEQESHAQWELAMKLDDARIVLRRPRDARSRDVLHDSSIDPYRTEIGSNRAAATVAVILGGVSALIIGLLAFEQTETGGIENTKWVAIAIISIAILVLALGKIALIRRR